MLATLSEYATDLFDLFYPKICLACSQKLLKGEEIICFKCESELPLANQWNDPENSVAKRFWGRVELQGAAALFLFEKGESVQHLLHALKYRKRQDVGVYLGEMLGEMLLRPESVIRDVEFGGTGAAALEKTAYSADITSAISLPKHWQIRSMSRGRQRHWKGCRKMFRKPK